MADHLAERLQEFLDRCNNDLMGLTDLVQGELTEAERLTLGALITVDVHACDVVRELLEAGIKQTSDFEWVSRLRYYWRDDVFVDMAQVRGQPIERSRIPNSDLNALSGCRFCVSGKMRLSVL